MQTAHKYLLFVLAIAGAHTTIEASQATATTTPSSCPTCTSDSQESPDTDTQYLNRAHASNYQNQLAHMLYNVLDKFPVELITLITSYIEPYEKLTCAQKLNEHKTCLTVLLPISPTQFASADRDGVIKIWELSAGKWTYTRTYCEHHNTVTALASPNKDWLISGARDGQIIFWYLPSKGSNYTIQENLGRINVLAPLSDESFVSGSSSMLNSHAIIMWEKKYQRNGQQATASWRRQQTLPTKDRPLFLIKLIFKKRCYVACGFLNGRINLYRDDRQSWDLTATYQRKIASPLCAMTHNPTSNSLICAYKKRIIILDQTLKPLRTLFPPLESSTGGMYTISTCAPWKDAHIALGISVTNMSQILLLKDTVQPEETAQAATDYAHAGPIANLICLGDQQLASAGITESTIKIWEKPYVTQNQSTTCVMLAHKYE